MSDNRIIAFQGERGAYSEIASQNYFSKSIKTLPSFSFEEVFKNIKNGKADSGIITVENTLYGSVFENYDLLLKYKIFVVGELNLQINHCLISSDNYNLNKIKAIYSHPQALGQCSHFLKSLKNNGEPSAAITSSRAAKIYKIKIIRRNIQNNKINFTRFFIINKIKNDKEPKNPKTTISFDLKSIPGALHKALGFFANAEIDLSMIESRPIPHKPFQYTFYMDFNGSLNDPQVKAVLKKLAGLTITIKKFGTYEKGNTYKS